MLNREGATPEELLEHLTPGSLELLHRVLTTRVVARRSLAALYALLAGKRLTKRELVQTFQSWLDPRGEIGGEEVILVEGKDVGILEETSVKSDTPAEGVQKESALQTRTGGIEEV
jgi:hypothetical protein